MAAMFHIANTNKPPEIPMNFSQDCRNFMSVCLQLDPSKRPNSEELLAHPWFRSELNFSEEKEIKTPRTANGHETNVNERSSRVPASLAASSPAIARNVDSPQRLPNVAPVAHAPALPLVSPLHTSAASPTARSSSFSTVQTSGSPPTGTVGSGNGAGRGVANKKVVQVIRSV
jgi:serine/threonine protein kinase